MFMHDVCAVFRPALPTAQLRGQQRASQETETVEEAEEERQQRTSEVSKNSVHADVTSAVFCCRKSHRI